MSETPKKEQEKEPECSGPKDVNSWEEDQKKRDYYYDDSHGYEIYVPDENDQEIEVEANLEHTTD